MSTMEHAPRPHREPPPMRHEWNPMTPLSFWLVVGTMFAITVTMISVIMVHHE